jgi:toxin-antitoxin system PIN domain toxin
VIAVDTNLLVYAHRPGSPFYAAARTCLTELADGRATWAIPWPCLHEFLGVVTHPRILNPPTPLTAALEQVSAWLESPSLMVLAEPEDYWPILLDVATSARVAGPLIHEARIAALCRAHGVRELWTADRDFGRFPGLIVRNPLVPEGVSEGRVAYRARRPGARRRRVRSGLPA